MILLRKSRYLLLLLAITKLLKKKKRARSPRSKSPRGNLQKKFRRVLIRKKLIERQQQKLIELSKQLSGKGKRKGLLISKKRSQTRLQLS